MRLKQRFSRYALSMVIVLSLLLVLFIYGINEAHKNNRYLTDGTVASSLILLFVMLVAICFLYCIGYNSRILYINTKGIVQKWFGIITYNTSWSDIKYIRIEMILSQEWLDSGNEAIVCSKIPIKYKNKHAKGYKRVVDLAWALYRPGEIFILYLEDLKPGQYEEFWSYVPDRLK